MTDKNIFAFKLFLSLNISNFNLFLCGNYNPPWKKSRSKSWGPVKHPLFQNLVGGSTPLPPLCRFSLSLHLHVKYDALELPFSPSSFQPFQNIEKFRAKKYFTDHWTANTIQLFVALKENFSGVYSFSKQVATKDNFPEIFW